jgi:hypothetical protein
MLYTTFLFILFVYNMSSTISSVPGEWVNQLGRLIGVIEEPVAVPAASAALWAAVVVIPIVLPMAIPVALAAKRSSVRTAVAIASLGFSMVSITVAGLAVYFSEYVAEVIARYGATVLSVFVSVALKTCLITSSLLSARWSRRSKLVAVAAFTLVVSIHAACRFVEPESGLNVVASLVGTLISPFTLPLIPYRPIYPSLIYLTIVSVYDGYADRMFRQLFPLLTIEIPELVMKLVRFSNWAWYTVVMSANNIGEIYDAVMQAAFQFVRPYTDALVGLHKAYEYITTYGFAESVKLLLLSDCESPKTWFLFWTTYESDACKAVQQYYDVQPEYSAMDINLLCLALLGVFALLFWRMCYERGTGTLRHIGNNIVSLFKHQADMSQVHIRNTFNAVEVHPAALSKGHPHPYSAAERKTASRFMRTVAHQVGMRPYLIQMSASDQRKGLAGCRTAYWAKDLTIEERPFEPKPNDLFMMVDVDMYIDMPKFLVENFRPTLVYTFMPTNCARNGNTDVGSTKNSKIETEYTFTFDELSQVHYNVTGGGSYTHKVWNYSYDTITAVKRFCGIPVALAVYTVDRKRFSSDREVIALMPVARYNIITAWYQSLVLGYNELRRLEVVSYVVTDRVSKVLRLIGLTWTLQAFTRLNVQHDRMYTCTSRPNSMASAKITSTDDDAVHDLAQTSTTPLSVHQVKQYTGNDIIGASILCLYHRSCFPTPPPVVQPAKDSMNVYQWYPRFHFTDAKPIMDPFMTPILAEAFVPTDCISNDVDGVKERIEKVRQPVFEVTETYLQYADEYARHLVPEEHKLHPVDQDYVYEKQKRPTQRRILDARLADPTIERIISSFVKKETYGGVKPTRLISTINGSDKCAYSMLIYAFSLGIMKDQKWYAFGKKPKEVAARVAELCERAKYGVVPTDLSKFDGHCSNLVRMLERTVLLRAFSQQYHDMIIDLHESQFGLTCFLPSGVSYDQGFARASGSPETAAFNSVVNSFIAYAALRMDGRDALEAWEQLGVYGGDDGLTPDVDEAIYVKAAEMIGQKLTISTLRRGDDGVTFLARMYSPEVWTGSPDSCCDLPRQLGKFHLTSKAGPYSSEKFNAMKLEQKLIAFSFTDANTPIICDLLFNYQRITGIKYAEHFECTDDLVEFRSYCSLFHPDDQYPNGNHGDWMTAYLQQCLPDNQYDQWSGAVAQLNTVHEMLTQMPLLRPPPVATAPKPAIVNGECTSPIVNGTQDLGEEMPEPKMASCKAPKREVGKIEPVSKALPPCRDFNGKGCTRRVCKFPHVKNNEYVCRSNGKCKENCPYSHTTSVTSGKAPCARLLRGEQCDGAECPFSHSPLTVDSGRDPLVESGATPKIPEVKGEESPPEVKENRKVTKTAGICRAFSKTGTCDREGCKFKHTKTDEATEYPKGSCWTFLKSGKCERKNCKFPHPK